MDLQQVKDQEGGTAPMYSGIDGHRQTPRSDMKVSIVGRQEG